MTDAIPATPTGKPDERNRDAWLLLGLITLDTITDAARWWEDDSNPFGVRGVPLGQDGWEWDGRAQIYRGEHGHVLDAGRLKNLSVATAHASERLLRKSATSVAVGKVDVAAWQRDFAHDIGILHVTQAALACGGFEKLEEVSLFKDAAQGSPDKPPGILFSIARLASFAQAVADGTEATVTAIQDRAAAYAEASNATFEAVKRASHAAEKDDKGRAVFLYERNALANADHCRDTKDSLGCPTCTRAGWVPIGSLPLPGLRSCRQNCLCSMDYSLVGNALGTN